MRLLLLCVAATLVLCGVPTSKQFSTYRVTQSTYTDLTIFDTTLQCKPASVYTLLFNYLNNKNAALYHVCFHNYNLIPQWTSHVLTASMFLQPQKRPSIEVWPHWEPTSIAGNGKGMKKKLFIFLGLRPGYDRGHLSPNGDFVNSENAAIATFNVINRAAQASAFNEKAWECVECFVRQYVSKKSEHPDTPYYIITGTAGKIGMQKEEGLCHNVVI